VSLGPGSKATSPRSRSATTLELPRSFEAAPQGLPRGVEHLCFYCSGIEEGRLNASSRR
jgi:hypothetical protein